SPAFRLGAGRTGSRVNSHAAIRRRPSGFMLNGFFITIHRDEPYPAVDTGARRQSTFSRARFRPTPGVWLGSGIRNHSQFDFRLGRRAPTLDPAIAGWIKRGAFIENQMDIAVGASWPALGSFGRGAGALGHNVASDINLAAAAFRHGKIENAGFFRSLAH